MALNDEVLKEDLEAFKKLIPAHVKKSLENPLGIADPINILMRFAGFTLRFLVNLNLRVTDLEEK